MSQGSVLTSLDFHKACPEFNKGFNKITLENTSNSS